MNFKSKKLRIRTGLDAAAEGSIDYNAFLEGEKGLFEGRMLIGSILDKNQNKGLIGSLDRGYLHFMEFSERDDILSTFWRGHRVSDDADFEVNYGEIPIMLDHFSQKAYKGIQESFENLKKGNPKFPELISSLFNVIKEKPWGNAGQGKYAWISLK